MSRRITREPVSKVAGVMFNLKSTDPRTWLVGPADRPYRCDWIEDSITIDRDGNVSCGLEDPHGQRSTAVARRAGARVQ